MQGAMNYTRALHLLTVVLVSLASIIRGKWVPTSSPCDFPAIYNFGDSNSDTGGISAAFWPISPPYGVSFFQKPAGRNSDGRLIIDFIAEHLGLPYLNSYLDSIGTSFRHGANFATGGSTIRRQNETIFENGISPFSLDIQTLQFDQFKLRTNELYHQALNSFEKSKLPRPREFSKALYTFDIGQNDIVTGFRKLPTPQLRAAIPDIRLYHQGARAFWIHNTGPIGCLPAATFYIRNSNPGFLNKYGCIKSHNSIAVELNRQLKARMHTLRAELPRAAITYVDIYSAQYHLIRNAQIYGFSDPLKICCGLHENNVHVWCGQRTIINGSEIFGAACGAPATCISWDGVHYSQAANQWVANHILNGSFSDPPMPIARAYTGGIAAAFYPPASPCGETYFHRPAGRASDGRLIIDFLAEHLGLPYLSPYLDSIESNYRHGANFATGGATVMRPNESWFENGVSPFSLEIQVEHYTQLKDRTDYFYKAKKHSVTKRLPRPEDISTALFTIDIGQNDIAAGIRKLSFDDQKKAVPQIVSQYTAQIQVLYQRGGRTFWIHNTGPIGCLPVATVKVKDPVPGYLDEHGCVKSQNDVAVEFNKQLKDEIVKLRSELSEAAIIYVDMYSVKYELITNGKNQGFENPFGICCGYHGIGYDVWCGNKGNVNGSEVFGGSCENPSGVVSWDGVHYSEAANRWIANRIVDGSSSDPPIAISRACHKQI
ncbi:hypothetical protein BUALT_Bualt04G0164800 [Buddleja alternifolia]|uniref:Esterase n=1 Tax=Buddleja alternifolia TaxID=168488 RepID=A0AAV6Y0S7_9LAMI|nr:hypothetical protein BUALT_Bualt04G0164800 [Buddleja alternifolia]